MNRNRLLMSWCLLIKKEKYIGRVYNWIIILFYIQGWIQFSSKQNLNDCQNLSSFLFPGGVIQLSVWLSSCSENTDEQKSVCLGCEIPSNPQEPSDAGLSGTAPPLFLVTSNCREICSHSQKFVRSVFMLRCNSFVDNNIAL